MSCAYGKQETANLICSDLELLACRVAFCGLVCVECSIFRISSSVLPHLLDYDLHSKVGLVMLGCALV